MWATLICRDSIRGCLQSPSHSHIWSDAHLLNLVLTDTTGSAVESASLFSLLNDEQFS